MTYENFSRHLRNMIFDKQSGKIKHIFTDVLAAYADYGRCYSLTINLLRYENLHLHNEIKEIYKINQLGINTDEEPYYSMIRNTIEQIIEENFEHSDEIMLQKTSDKQTEINIVTKVTQLTELIKNHPQYIQEINDLLDNLQAKIGLDKINESLTRGINITSKKYILGLIDILEPNPEILTSILPLSTDEIKLIYTTIKLLKINGKYEEEKDIIFNLIIERRILDLYNYYRNLEYNHESLQKVDELLDNIDYTYELSAPEALSIKDYLNPVNDYISYDERQLLIIRNGAKKYKNYSKDEPKELILKK